MVFHDDDSLVPRLRIPAPAEVTPAEPTPEVLNAVRAIVRERESRGVRIHLPYRIQAKLRERYGIDAPVEQVAGALQQI